MQYLNHLQAQLVAASRELADQPAAVRARRPAGVLVRRPARLSVLLALVTLAGASAAIAETNVFSGPDTNLGVPSPLGTAQTIPSGLASAFADLRRPATSADALPAGTTLIAVAGGLSAHYGINPGLSRFVGTVDGTRVWIVAGSTGACMYTDNAGGSCARDDHVTADGLFGLQVPTSGSADTFIGILPDSATVTATNADGTLATVTRAGAAWEVSNDPNLRSVTIDEANGHTVTLTVPTNSPPATTQP
jgi:hypothetical protein